ncbi:MAG: hypothetical protein WD971_03715 [Pirellulales bacterium]
MLFAVALAVGCQSGVERDVVQREMRQQEDQIYALEDYLSEYQQLLCDARSENAMLKRQMVQGQFREEGSSARADDSDTLPPPTTQPTSPSGRSSPAVEPSVPDLQVPPLDLSEPAVPPLEDQSTNDPEILAHEVQPAAAEIEVVPAAATAVVLRGEVRLDDQESGPRVLLEVEPVADDGELAEFHGSLSLLVLDLAAREKEQQLARWDFQPADLEPMVKPTERGASFEFPLQLPADAPTNRPLELWVRLLPEEGEKLLGRTTMDLGRAGRFASAEVTPIREKRQSVRVAVAELPIEPSRRKAIRTTGINDQQSGWQTAKPGDKAKPQAASKTGSEWKVATRPVPEVESTPVVESEPVHSYLPPSTESDRYSDAAAPQWSPERPDGGAGEPHPEPAWSPTR